MTQRNARPETQHVSDVSVAKLLFNDRVAMVLGVLFRESMTVSQLAEKTSTHQSTMLGIVKRMTDAGIIGADGFVTINGRRLVRYQASAEQFIIPLPLVEDFMLSIERRFQDQFNELFTKTILRHHYQIEPVGVRVGYQGDYGVSYGGFIGDDLRYFPAPGIGPLVQFTWQSLWLTEKEARTLQLELEAITNRYTFGDRFGRKPFLVGTHLAPHD